MFFPMPFEYDDGGRELAGFKGTTGDCACRAVAIASGRPYREVYDSLVQACTTERPSVRRRGKSHPRTGLHHHTMRQYLAAQGWIWTPKMGIGTGCRFHLAIGEVPDGNVIVSLSKHYVAVINGVVRDTEDPTREGTRCVYGIWERP